MKIGHYSVEKRKRFKAQERLADERAARRGRGAERQARNRLIPNAKEWTIEKTPKPMVGEVLD